MSKKIEQDIVRTDPSGEYAYIIDSAPVVVTANRTPEYSYNYNMRMPDFTAMKKYADAFRVGEITREQIPFKYKVYLPQTRSEAQNIAYAQYKEKQKAQETLRQLGWDRLGKLYGVGGSTLIAAPALSAGAGLIGEWAIDSSLPEVTKILWEGFKKYSYAELASRAAKGSMHATNMLFMPSDTDNEYLYKRANVGRMYEPMMKNPYNMTQEEAVKTWNDFVTNDVLRNSTIPEKDQNKIIYDRIIGNPLQGIYVNPADSILTYQQKLLQGKKDNEDRAPLIATDLRDMAQIWKSNRAPFIQKVTALPFGVTGTIADVINLPVELLNMTTKKENDN